MKIRLRLWALALFSVIMITACGCGGSDTPRATGLNPASVAVDPSWKFVYVANCGSNDISAYTINVTTGALTAGTAVVAGTNPASVAVDP